MNRRMIARIWGHIMCVEGLFMLPALALALIWDERRAALAFLISACALWAPGLLMRRQKPGSWQFYAREGMVTVAGAWAVVSLFGALPFYISGATASFTDALFESVSGFTTTGATTLPDMAALPRSLLYWCAFTHWLGGMGVLLFALAVIPLMRGGGGAMYLLRAESTGPSIGKLVPRIKKTALILYGMYLGLTLAQLAALLMAGVSAFDAIPIALGTAGTGGFAPRSDSLASYGPHAQAVVTAFMALFGVNFSVFYALAARLGRSALKNEELRVYLGVMVGATVLIFFNVRGHFADWAEALRHAAFQTVSALTTTGYATAAYDQWPELSRMLMVVMMILGASAGSTGGGIKIARVIIVAKSVRGTLARMLRPNAVRLPTLNGVPIEEEVVRGVFAFLALYAMIAACALIIIALDGFSFETNVTAVISALSNTGRGLGAIGPAGHFGVFSAASKWTLIAGMLLGRLEIIPVLILCAPSTWRR